MSFNIYKFYDEQFDQLKLDPIYLPTVKIYGQDGTSTHHFSINHEQLYLIKSILTGKPKNV